jgi:hypothetical protein
MNVTPQSPAAVHACARPGPSLTTSCQRCVATVGSPQPKGSQRLEGSGFTAAASSVPKISSGLPAHRAHRACVGHLGVRALQFLLQIIFTGDLATSLSLSFAENGSKVALHVLDRAVHPASGIGAVGTAGIDEKPVVSGQCPVGPADDGVLE